MYSSVSQRQNVLIIVEKYYTFHLVNRNQESSVKSWLWLSARRMIWHYVHVRLSC